MAIRTQGTQVFFIDPDSNEVVAVECATAHNTGGAPADQIETTCLESTTRTYTKGLRTPGQASITINFDPQYDSHMRLAELALDDTIEDLRWATGWSDGTDAPTIGSDGDFDLPTTRSWVVFNGYIVDVPYDFQQNTVVTSEVPVQKSGPHQTIRKVVTP